MFLICVQKLLAGPNVHIIAEVWTVKTLENMALVLWITLSVPIELGSLLNILELHLSKNHFTGLIPPSLGNLYTLHSLKINYNYIKGNISFEFGKLSNLEIL